VTTRLPDMTALFDRVAEAREDGPFQAHGDELRDLMDIESRDPDGFSHRPPTEADHDAFHAYILTAYGEDRFIRYMTGGWGPRSDV
jgi:hypothetical protein